MLDLWWLRLKPLTYDPLQMAKRRQAEMTRQAQPPRPTWRVEALRWLWRLSAFTVVSIVLVNFGVAFLTSFKSSASWRIDIPWSDWVDFLELEDGSILVHLGMAGRIHRYSPDGRLLEVWLGYSRRGLAHWSVTTDGELVACRGDDLMIYNDHGQLLRSMTSDLEGRLAWRYLGVDQGFEPFRVDDRRVAKQGRNTQPPPIPETVVAAGEVVCASGHLPKREIFQRRAGGELVRHGNRLEVWSSEGKKVVELGTPWYLWWLQLPFPGIPLGLLAGVFIVRAGPKLWPDSWPRDDNTTD